MEFPWQPRAGGGSQCHAIGLGIVEVYHDRRSGWCCDINKRRAWSNIMRGSETLVQLHVQAELRKWAFIESFKPIIPPAPKP